MSKKVAKKIQEAIWRETKKGNVVFSTLEGLQTCPVKEFIKQPAEGILYDLNRLPEVVATFIDDPKWINDYAVGLVIKTLHEELWAAQHPLQWTLRHVRSSFQKLFGSRH